MNSVYLENCHCSLFKTAVCTTFLLQFDLFSKTEIMKNKNIYVFGGLRILPYSNINKVEIGINTY